MLDEHNSPQWYDIIHFEHKLSWLYFWLPQKASYQWREYSLIMNPLSFPKLADVGLSSNSKELAIEVMKQSNSSRSEFQGLS